MTNRRLPVIAAFALFGTAVAITVIVWATSAPPPGPPTAAEIRELADTACPKVTAAFFYRIAKAGKTSHLLGTRHTGVALAKFPPAVGQAFDTAKIAVFESVGGEASAPPSPAAAVQTVEAGLGDKLWDKYRMLVGDDLADRVNPLGPNAATAALVLLYEDTSQAIDRELAERARAQRKELVGLEDEAESKQVGDQLLGFEMLKRFVKALPSRFEIAAQTTADLEIYCAGKSAKRDAAGDPIIANTDARTRKWIAKLEAVFARGDAFVVVGALHVIDRGGLIELLRERGYDVTHVD